MEKKYRTRDGKDVRVLCVDRKSKCGFSVVALVGEGDFESTISYRAEGNVFLGGTKSALDLIEVKPKQFVWINLYPSMDHHTKELADKNAGDNRIACIRVEFEEGEGLNDEQL